jgi:hypothetical protein
MNRRNRSLINFPYHNCLVMSEIKPSVNDSILLSSDEVFQYPLIVEIAFKIQNKRDQALFVMEFLTGGRVNEILGRVRKRDFEYQTVKGDKFLVIKNFWTEKTYTHPIRDMPIPVALESELVAIIKDYLSPLHDDTILFTIKRCRAWKIISDIISQYKEKSITNKFRNSNHFMRHCRNTDLVVRYGYDILDLMKWNGWLDERSAKKYVHLNKRDLMRKMTKDNMTVIEKV